MELGLVFDGVTWPHLVHGSTGVNLGLHFPLIPILLSVDYEHSLGVNAYASGIGSGTIKVKWYYS
jgi:hypothetical protein